ncbi:MAG: hypothetical protein AB7P37_04640 [Ramlibacter sp.]
MHTVFRFILRLVFLVAGLVFAASLALALLVLLAFWGLRMLWARLTGQPVTPFVMRIDPRGGFNRMYRGAAAKPVNEPGPAESARRREIADVTDVEVKEPRS